MPGESTNFIVAGMLPDTTYLMRHVLDNGTVSAPLTFTTGSLPTTVTFPTFTVPQAPGAGTDLTQDVILHAGIGGPADTVATLATDLMGDIVWYYYPAANNFPDYALSLVPGGTVLLLGGTIGAAGASSALREVDLAGDTLRETNVGAINAELAALGQPSITSLSHEAQRLPNGDTAVLADSPRTIDVDGTPTTYDGDMVLVLDRNFQVAWAWDPFKWLDTSRLGTGGEGPNDWTHANSIAWSPADGNLIVSLRSQDWVIKIAYGNGTGDGHVIWRLGPGGDFTINSTDPYPWFTHQHDVRYINDTTITLFDDGNIRVGTTPEKDSRGQELVLDEKTMTATLVVNADMGNFSPAVGSAQQFPDGNLAFTSGFLTSPSGNFGQSIEVLPDGTRIYVQQMNGMFEYRSYFMSTLYGPPSLADFLQGDGSSQGTWVGTYGAAGYDLIGGPSSLPSYDSVTPSGAKSYTWAASTTDPRALQIPGSADRIAACWFSPTGFTVDVDLPDGVQHTLGLYFLDWDSTGRAEQVQISDAATGRVLDTRSIASFHSGLYLDYAVGGHVVLTITRTGGANAVLSGLFLDQPPAATVTTAALAKRDDATQGTWVGTYGAAGYDLIGGPSSLPSYAAVTPSGQQSYTWAASTTDPRALQIPGSADRIAACWFSPTGFTVDVDLRDGQVHNLGLYFLDWDGTGRAEQVQISDAATGRVLDTRSIASFHSGLYLDYAVGGHVVLTITRTGGANAVLSGLFLDQPPAASFLQRDDATQGTWVGTYGAAGYDLIGGPSSLPSYAAVTPSGQQSYTWAASTTDPRALQIPGSADRIAACWFSVSSFKVDVDLTDGQAHNLGLYFLDWDSADRAEQVQISDAETGRILSTRSIASFHDGAYLDYRVGGHIIITIERTGGANAVLSGLFLD